MESLKKLWEYNDWANLSLLEAIKKQEENISPNVLRLLSHIMNTQHVWLTRISGVASAMGAWDQHSLEICKSLHEESSFGIKKVLEFHAHSLGEEVSYTNSLGTAYVNTIHDILVHTFNHGTYHRAQIAMDMRQTGLIPLNTDYITYVREQQQN